MARWAAQIFRAKEEPWAEVRLFIFDFHALFAIPIIVFGFNCHANVVTVFKCAAPHNTPLCYGAC